MVAKDGASVETSHLYWPELSRMRSFNFIDFFSLFGLVCGQKEYGNVFALLMENFCSGRDVMSSSSDGSTLGFHSKLGLTSRDCIRVHVFCAQPILLPRQSTLDCICEVMEFPEITQNSIFRIENSYNRVCNICMYIYIHSKNSISKL